MKAFKIIKVIKFVKILAKAIAIIPYSRNYLIQNGWNMTAIKKLSIGMIFFLKLFKNFLFKSHNPYISIAGIR